MSPVSASGAGTGASASGASAYGFVVTRGRGVRGYRPEQVEAFAGGLSQERDAAWERVARLTVLHKEMEAEAERLREAVARLAPQTYASLGKRAQYLLELVEEETAAVRHTGRGDAQSATEAAGRAGAELRDAAQAYADEVRGAAEEWARQREAATRAAADEVRVAARREVKETRSAALEALRDMRRRCESALADQAKEQAGRIEELEREDAGRVAAAEARETAAVAEAEARLSDAKRALAEAEEAARHRQEDADAAAAELVAQARAREERIGRETEGVLREHGEAREELRAHMDHVRSSLAALTGRAPAESE
ncbi:cellulose-binding protein [Streptomyces sp. NPDC088785]|uniref:cellulose-binding protein n=1 Tax=Streptomyces sp. NPDC088785 TaxID=3365897 RepID=UPI00380EC0C9